MKVKPEKVKHFNYEMIKNILSAQHNSCFFSIQVQEEKIENRKRKNISNNAIYKMNHWHKIGNKMIR